MVPDKASALHVARGALEAQYGTEFIAGFEPYEAVLVGGTWEVTGDSPAHKAARREQERSGLGHRVSVRGGGAPCVIVSARDGKVERVYFAR